MFSFGSESSGLKVKTQMKTNYIATLAALSVAVAGSAFGASHNDAPMIAKDPAANITDVYTFIGNRNGQKVLNLIMTVNPLSDPGNGVNYYSFDEDVLYSLHIGKPVIRNGQAVFTGDTSIRYNFRFKNNYKNRGTILSYGLGTEAGPIQTTGDARQNLLQTYSVERVQNNRSRILGRELEVAPVNVGERTTPNYYSNGQLITGATSFNELDSYTRETIHNIDGGVTVYAGQREDGFYADVPAIFDFLGVRNPGVDGFSGYNVHAIAIQVPVSEIVGNNDNGTVGVYATTSRPRVTIRGINGKDSGEWVQVGRMGNPLFNETLVALKDKDRYNMLSPRFDTSIFQTYASNCELAFLLNAVFSTNFVVNGRTDLVGIFMPDLIKVDTTTGPVPLAGQEGFSRLSFIGGDTTANGSGAQVASGWPNGRRLGDDVVDIALTAIASGPSYSSITNLGDNSSANDTEYNQVFPYAGTPFGGPTTTLH